MIPPTDPEQRGEDPGGDADGYEAHGSYRKSFQRHEARREASDGRREARTQGAPY